MPAITNGLRARCERPRSASARPRAASAARGLRGGRSDRRDQQCAPSADTARPPRLRGARIGCRQRRSLRPARTPPRNRGGCAEIGGSRGAHRCAGCAVGAARAPGRRWLARWRAVAARRAAADVTALPSRVGRGGDRLDGDGGVAPGRGADGTAGRGCVRARPRRRCAPWSGGAGGEEPASLRRRRDAGCGRTAAAFAAGRLIGRIHRLPPGFIRAGPLTECEFTDTPHKTAQARPCGPPLAWSQIFGALPMIFRRPLPHAALSAQDRKANVAKTRGDGR